MKATPSLVTVITATFNLLKAGRVEFFRQCLESVHAQTHGNIEHLIIDGASTDGTLELLHEYEARGWVKVYSEPDKGIYDAFNKGIQRASGAYCAFMNSDDLWHDTRGVEMSVRMLELAHGDFSYASATYVRPDGQVAFVREPDMGAFFCLIPCCHQTMFYRTELLREYMYDSEHYRLAADFDLTTRLLLSGKKGVYVPLNFTTFRLGGFSDDASLHEEECTRVFRHYYGPFIGNEAANRLYQKLVPVNMLRMLGPVVQPDIMALAERSYITLRSKGGEILSYEPKLPVTLRKWRAIFGLTVWSVAVSGGRAVYRLFNVIPMIVNTYSQDAPEPPSCRAWLFGFLPLWKSCRRGESSHKYYLFHVLPVWSVK